MDMSTLPHRDPELGDSLTPQTAQSRGFTVLAGALIHQGPTFWCYQNVIAGERHYILTRGNLHEVFLLTLDRRVVALTYRELERKP
jgi:hypothetical protein